MRPTRRKTLVGLGALATSSGAIFSSAAFSNSVNPTSDMRVVVADSLTLEPGIFFRSSGAFDPSGSNTPGNQSAFNQTSSSLFSSNELSSNVDVDELPAAAINDATNGDLFLETAVPIDDTGTLGNDSNGLLQVTNDSAEAKSVAIRFTKFGQDGDGSTDALTRDEVVDTLKFKDSSDAQISTDSVSSPYDEASVANEVTIQPGSTEQIYLDYDTESTATELRTAAGSSSNPFNNTSSGQTIDLVDEIKVGVEE